MKHYGTERLVCLPVVRQNKTLLGNVTVEVLNFLVASDPMPLMVAATALLVRDHRLFLMHLLVNDDDRKKGYATEIVDWIIKTRGRTYAAWVSPEGEAFARAYIAKRGEQPKWKIGPYSEAELSATWGPEIAKEAMKSV